METPRTLSGRCTEAVMDVLRGAGITWASVAEHNAVYSQVLAALEREHGDGPQHGQGDYVFPDHPVAGAAQLELDALLARTKPGSALRAVLGPGYTPHGSTTPGNRPGKGR